MGFVTVLLTILKILGLILGGILGLVLFLLLLILLVPIRYRGNLAYSDQNGEPFQLQAKASYLLHILSASFQLIGKEMDFSVKIFGVPIELDPEKRAAKRRKRKRKRRSARERKSSKKTASAQQETKNTQLKESELSSKEATHETQIKQQNNTSESKKNKDDSKSSEKKSVFKRLKEHYNKFVASIRQLRAKLQTLLQKKEEWQQILENEENQEAFRCALHGLGKILKHVMPRKHLIQLHFGLEDPSTTGQIIGAIYASAFLLGLRVELKPEFEQKVMEVQAFAKGRIRIISIVIVLLRIYHNKKIKELIHRFLDT